MPAFFLSQRLYEGRTVCTALIFIPPQAVRPFRKRGDFSLFIWDFVASTVMDNLIDWFYGQIVGFLGNFFSAMGNMGVEIFELEWVQAIVLFFSQLGWALYGVSLVVCAFEFGIEYTTAGPISSTRRWAPSRASWAVSLFTILPVRLYALSVSLQGRLSAGSPATGPVSGMWGSRSSQTSAVWKASRI